MDIEQGQAFGDPESPAIENGLPSSSGGPHEDSWQRSLHDFGLDPAADTAPHVLDAFEWQRRRNAVGCTLALADEEMSRLNARVQDCGYAVLLAEPGGVIIDRRCRSADYARLDRQGSRIGALWSEAAEGTNGIGTCIALGRPLSVHRQQHFRLRDRELSCSSAPIFDASGQLRAILTVASDASEMSDHAHAMALAVVADSARIIEEREFRTAHSRLWTLVLQRSDGIGRPLLLGLDRDRHIVAADCRSRHALDLDDVRLAAGIAFGELFEGLPQKLTGAGGDDIALRLSSARSEALQEWHGLATPPLSTGSLCFGAARSALHSRPRAGSITGRKNTQLTAPAAARGGLSPRTVQRVCAHIESHLEKTLTVEVLAQIAGLSTAHFTRSFERSVGLTPHRYIIQQRVCRAAQLLAGTELAASEIAQITGFADQSHLARHFLRGTGATPLAYRHANRASAPQKHQRRSDGSSFVQASAA